MLDLNRMTSHAGTVIDCGLAATSYSRWLLIITNYFPEEVLGPEMLLINVILQFRACGRLPGAAVSDNSFVPFQFRVLPSVIKFSYKCHIKSQVTHRSTH